MRLKIFLFKERCHPFSQKVLLQLSGASTQPSLFDKHDDWTTLRSGRKTVSHGGVEKEPSITHVQMHTAQQDFTMYVTTQKFPDYLHYL